MAANPEQARSEQEQLAAERFHDPTNAERRQRTAAAIKRNAPLEEFNDPERLARRLDRLSRYLAREQVPVTAEEMPQQPAEEVIASALERTAEKADPDVSPVAVGAATMAEVATAPEAIGEEAALAPGQLEHRAGVVLEAIIGSRDYVGIRYLEAGVAASRAVCRINIRDARRRTAGYGTGSLVSPRLLLTNHHVLGSAEVARLSVAEFDYQDGLDGKPLQPQVFTLDPETFFLADRERDFALVAVEGGERGPSRYGFNPLIEAEGKAVLGEFVTIIQHPGGEKKQVALRENKIVDLLELFVHYQTDTEPGSSGSPVFNDQWEVVALHHASVRAPDRKELGGIMNEGIRASRILRHVKEQQHNREQQALVDQLFARERISLTPPPHGPQPDEAPAPRPPAQHSAPVAAAGASASVELNLPLTITVSVSAGSVQTNNATAAPAAPLEPSEDGAEAITIDTDYSNRRGYRDDFLGRDQPVALPTLSAKQKKQAARIESGRDRGEYVLPYHHFSVVMNKERRLAFFTAVNIDGRNAVPLKRESDKWALDPRIPLEEQTGEDVYADNDLDRGHLVRRLDPAWGRTRTLAKRANDDTYHFTNCTPQHKDFNQNRTTWAGLEDYILKNTNNHRFRASVFTGPVFDERDDDYRQVKLPRQFWKVVAMVKGNAELSATGYLLSQEQLLRDLEAVGDFSYGAYRTYQVPIRRIEQLSGLTFRQLANTDPLAGLEAAAAEREIASLDQITL